MSLNSLYSAPMKAILILFILSSTAFAQDGELARKHEGLCAGKSDCLLSLIPLETQLKGSCSGKLFEQLNCDINYVQDGEAAKLSMICLDNASVEAINQVLPSEGISYQAAALTPSEITVDPKTYTVFDHPAVKLYIEHDGALLSGSKIEFHMNGEVANFTDVVCR